MEISKYGLEGVIAYHDKSELDAHQADRAGKNVAAAMCAERAWGLSYATQMLARIYISGAWAPTVEEITESQ